MTPAESLGKLIEESRNLRDHLMHVAGQDSAALAQALQPFDRATDPLDTSDAQRIALADAFENAHDSARRSIDEFTLSEVLRGNSPHRAGSSSKTTFWLAALGFVLVAAAFHFTFWANRTAFLVAQAEQFLEFDHFNKLMRLVELQNYFDQNDNANPALDMEPQLVYLEGITDLRAHYINEQSLPRNMRSQMLKTNPARPILDDMKRDYCTAQARQAKAQADHAAAQEKLLALGQPQETVSKAGGLDPVSTLPEPPPPAPAAAPRWSIKALLFTCPSLPVPATLPAPVSTPVDAGLTGVNAKVGAMMEEMDPPPPPGFLEGVFTVEEAQQKTMSAAGRARLINYANSQHEVKEMKQKLRELLSLVHLWALPIIYGMLGSVVYCMSRVLSPDFVPLGAIYSLARTLFAGLAALTFSMLIVPANVLSSGIEMNQPLVYLASFIFGYSIEAFINMLNRLNRYLTSSLTPKPNG